MTRAMRVQLLVVVGLSAFGGSAQADSDPPPWLIPTIDAHAASALDNAAAIEEWSATVQARPEKCDLPLFQGTAAPMRQDMVVGTVNAEDHAVGTAWCGKPFTVSVLPPELPTPPADYSVRLKVSFQYYGKAVDPDTGLEVAGTSTKWRPLTTAPSRECPADSALGQVAVPCANDWIIPSDHWSLRYQHRAAFHLYINDETNHYTSRVTAAWWPACEEAGPCTGT